MRPILSDVEQEYVFWLKDGTQIKNLYELMKALNEMADEIYIHHVNDQRNDFYNWVKDVYQDEKLAAMLLKAKTKQETIKAIEKRIKVFEIKKPAEKIRHKARNQKVKKAEYHEVKKVIKHKIKNIKNPEMKKIEVKKVEKPVEIVRKEEEKKETEKENIDELLGEKPSKMGSAVVVLIVLMAAISLTFLKEALTGAAVLEMDSSDFAAVSIVSITVLIAIIVLIIKKVK